jgi:MFS transporter, DHA3 family, multidrug efflux protein
MNNPLHTFYNLLINTTVASVANLFVWFALTFWIFLETKSVLITSYVAGGFAVATMLTALFFGTIVDHNKKKTAMLYSSGASLLFYLAGAGVLTTITPEDFTATSPHLWALIASLMAGSVAGNLRNIALSTTVTLLFSENRDKMNGLVGTANGIAFACTSVLSGLAIGFLGMGISLTIAIIVTILTIAHLLFITLPEDTPAPKDENTSHLDLRGSIAAVRETPGLFPLIFFTTFNNFLGGVFMALMDAYGLSLVSVQAWGLMLALMSVGFLFGGLYIARYGLSSNPVRRMLVVNCINWAVCLVFVIQPSIVLLAIGMLMWMTLYPFIEATEQTIIQKVVPFERQGRVVWSRPRSRVYRHSSHGLSRRTPHPIPFHTIYDDWCWGNLIGSWFGVGPDRGIALVFIAAGIIGLIVTLLAFHSRAYRVLSRQFTTDTPAVAEPVTAR